jgi:hypothetical protein
MLSSLPIGQRLTVSHAVLAAALAALMILVIASATGVRGTDAYWYVSEVRAAGEGDPRANSLFPGLIQSDPDYLVERPFIHDTALPHLLGPLGTLIGAYNTWLVFNLLCVGAAAALIYATALRVGKDREGTVELATLSSAAFVMLPITFWQTSQPGPELALASLCAAACFVAVSGWRREFVFLSLLLILCLGQSLRSMFEPAVVLCTGYFMVSAWLARPNNRLVHTLSYGLAGLLVLGLLQIGDDTLSFSLAQLAQNGAETGDNMELWLSPTPLEIDIGAIVGKMIRSVLGFVEISTVQLFFAPFSGLVLLTVAAVWLRLRTGVSSIPGPEWAVLGVCVTALALMMVIVLIHQNQFRYTVMATPALICAFVTWLAGTRFAPGARVRWVERGMALGLVLALAVNSVLALRVADEGAVSEARVDAYFAGAGSIPTLRSADRVVDCFRRGDSLAMAYAWPDRVIVHFDPQTGEGFFWQTVEATEADVLVCPASEAEALLGPGYEMLNVGSISELGGSLAVYDLVQAKKARDVQSPTIRD